MTVKTEHSRMVHHLVDVLNDVLANDALHRVKSISGFRVSPALCKDE